MPAKMRFGELSSAALLGLAVFLLAMFGIFTRPAGQLAAFWPANAFLLGVMVRYPGLSTPYAWAGAMSGYLAADIITGGGALSAALLTGANVTGAITGFLLFSLLEKDDRRLRRPLSVFYLLVIATAASAAAGLVGAPADVFLFDGAPLRGWVYWFVAEFVNYIAFLPVMLTLPDWLGREFGLLRQHSWTQRSYRALPILAFGASATAGMMMGGPGALGFPVPALLWCAISYSLFATALLALAYSVWMLLTISSGHLPLLIDAHSRPVLLSVRLGVALVTLAPLVVASVSEERRGLLDRLRNLATRDPLTGILNRNAFRERAHAVLSRLWVDRRPVAVLMLDIDRFKDVNDSYGHAAGDRVLTAFTDIMRDQLRGDDVLARMGGEEFAVLLPGCIGEDAEAIAGRIGRAFEACHIALPDGRNVSTTVSIGIAVSAEAPAAIEPLLMLADEALYRAKQSGRNRFDVAYNEAPGETREG